MSAVAAVLMAMSTGCFESTADDPKTSKKVNDADVISQERDSDIEADLKIRERAIETDGKYVYDDEKILTDGEFDALNSYVAWFSKAFKISAAVVLTNDIGDSTPEEYAASAYSDYCSGDGVLFLINNDTKEDYFYRNGLAAEYISDYDTEILFSVISPMLAMEEYVSAAERVLEEAELSLPEYISDRSATLDKDTVLECNEILKKASGENTLNIYYVLGTGTDKMEDFAQSRFETFYGSKTNTAFLVLDGNNGNNYLIASGELSFMSEKKAELEAEIKKCYTKKSGVDLKKACEIFAEYSSEEK